MSSSEADWAALRELCARIDALVAGGRSAEAPDDVVTALLSTATRLYRDATHEGGRDIPAFSDASGKPYPRIALVDRSLISLPMGRHLRRRRRF